MSQIGAWYRQGYSLKVIGRTEYFEKRICGNEVLMYLVYRFIGKASVREIFLLTSQAKPSLSFKQQVKRHFLSTFSK